MKKLITILFVGSFLSLSLLSNAQQFWIEKWTGSTAQGQLTYTGPNGAWSVQASGANGADSNAWYFSNWEEGMSRDSCGKGQTGPATAHMGITANSPYIWPLYQLLGATNPDQGAVIDDDNGHPTNTNLRLQSPIINCTGKSTITLSFNYIEGKSKGNDYTTVMYSSNGGTTWSLLSTPAELDSCSGGQGHWTYYSVALPASANNNSTVKIGFNWTNNSTDIDDSAFNNYFVPIVSFAVDSVVLSTPAVKPVAKFTALDTVVCKKDTVYFTDLSTNIPTSWAWTFTGGTPATSTLQNPKVVYTASGMYSVKLVAKNSAGKDSVTVTNLITVGNCTAGVENIPANTTISLYPNPANNSINLAFNKSVSGNVQVEINDITGRMISSQTVNATEGKIMSMNVSGMASGIYIVKVIAGSNVYFNKFIKQ